MWSELLTALGLVAVIEGLIYALFPNFVKRMAAEALGFPESQLRIFGVLTIAIGVLIVWLIRG